MAEPAALSLALVVPSDDPDSRLPVAVLRLRPKKLWTADVGQVLDDPAAPFLHGGRLLDVDAFGAPLRSVRAGSLVPFSEYGEVKMYPMHRAAWELLKALPPRHPVILYWGELP